MSHEIFDNYLVAIRKNKITLKLPTKLPAYFRMCILDLSKVLMYEFHYDYIKNKYGSNSRPLFTATGSLMYETKTEYFYKDISKNKEIIGFSNYSTGSKYYDISNKLALGKMKDE